MNRGVAVLGYLFGVLVGGFLVFLTVLGNQGLPDSSRGDELLQVLPVSPSFLIAETVGWPSSSFGLIALLAIQVLVFWGAMGALAPQGRYPKARIAFFALLFLHWLVALLYVRVDHKLFTAGSEYWSHYVLYAGFMACLLAAMLLTWLIATAVESGTNSR